MPSRPASTLFEDAVDIPQWLEADRGDDLRKRLRRDRAIALRLGRGGPLRRVRAWWQRLETGERPQLGRRLERARLLITLVLAAAGIACGALLTLAVFGYEGRYPVNVVAALALLVGLPLLSMLLTLLLLPGRVPGLRGLQDALAAINIGNLAASLFNRLAAARAAQGFELGWPDARAGAAARFAKWQVLAWSQVFGACLSLGALVMAFLLVVFTDLAFGWSTTLDVSAAQAGRLVEWIAAPWSAWLPAAVPGTELLAESRFFRLEDLTGERPPPGRLTGWWPFVLMALLVYGILPRLAMLALARWRLSAALRALLLDDPSVRALLDRMESAALESGADGAVQGAADGAGEPRPAAPVRIAARARVIVWNRALEGEALERWLERQLGAGLVQCIEAGAQGGTGSDEEALEALDPAERSMVLVVTKAWEPPMLDVVDFLELLHRRLGDAVSIVVVPVGLGGRSGEPAAVEAWRRTLARHGAGGVYVQELPA